MESQTEVAMEPAADDAVYVEDVRDTRYGVKAVLRGDTYELLSSHGQDLASELDFHEHHCAFDDELEAWTIDPGSLGALDDVLRSAGHALGGLAGRVIDELDEMTEGAEAQYWAEHGIRVKVVYESAQAGRAMSKEGVVSAVDRDERWVNFKRDDGTVNRLFGDELRSTYSRHPYMGDVKCVVLGR